MLFSYENFGGQVSALPQEQAKDSAALSDEGYEVGYRAGWDDAVLKSKEDAGRISIDLEENLQRISFDFHQSRTAILGELEKIFDTVLDKALPELIQASLGQQVKAIVMTASKQATEGPFVIWVNPESAPDVEGVAQSIENTDLVVKTDSTLGPGQVRFDHSMGEEQLDLDNLCTELAEITRAYFGANKSDEILQEQSYA